MNLVVNARDAMPRGGKLTVETGNVEIDEAFAHSHLGTEPGSYVLLAVSDRVSAWKPRRAGAFSSHSSPPRRRARALGSGSPRYSVSSSRAAAAFGCAASPIRAAPSRWPRVEGELEVRLPSLAPTSLRGSETILLVEDEESVRVVARRILERHGYHVIVPQNASEAFLLREQHPDRIHLLLTDVVMPLVGGAELAAGLLTRWPDMKVLFMSGYTDGSVFSHDLLENGAAFLQKPFTAELLAQKVRSVLDGEA